MNLKQFKYVLALAEKESFSKAAMELNVSQPSLSQYIRRVEEELGVVLFDRSGALVKLTDAGRVYIEAGKKILDTERRMMNRFSDFADYKTGTLTVGIAPTRCQYLMPRVVKKFAEKYPGMHLVIEERFLSNLIEDAEHGEFDLFVATLPVDGKKFSYELMMHEEFVLAVPKNSLLFSSLSSVKSIDPAHLYPVIDIVSIDNADYVALSDTQPSQMLLSSFCEEFGISVKTAVKCMSIETQFSMVKSGVGSALVPSSIAKYADSPEVAFFSLAQKSPDRDMAVIWNKDSYLSEPLLALKDILVSC